MKFRFHKYQGTGNDFIMIDDREALFPIDDIAYIAHCCDRRFGIGADGLILIQNHPTADFKMVYFNADGRESTLCGNGARCTVAFAASLGIIEKQATFMAIDGRHTATIKKDHSVALRMHDVSDFHCEKDHTFLDTGSPHHVTMVTDLPHFAVVEKGRKIRNGAPYFEAGSNVNFVEKVNDNTFAVRTYERGVEDETLSCGTGATAVALAMHKTGVTAAQSLNILVEGGQLTVSFQAEENTYTNIDLQGPATFVFEGEIA
ncbi:MAG: diaminopimelate epimerase [Flavobacteriaceae bacterium]